MTVIIAFAVFFRVLITWIYNVTASSVLLAASLHASFNTASGATFVERLSPGGTAESTASLLPLLTVVAIASVVTLGSRGRLGLTRDPDVSDDGSSRLVRRDPSRPATGRA